MPRVFGTDEVVWDDKDVNFQKSRVRDLGFCAPVALTDSPYTCGPDFWAVGVMVFVMLAYRKG